MSYNKEILEDLFQQSEQRLNDDIVAISTLEDLEKFYSRNPLFRARPEGRIEDGYKNEYLSFWQQEQLDQKQAALEAGLVPRITRWSHPFDR